jgi:dipeptidyl aminopeptidase/acylaminoacyl peptidase
MIERLLRPVCSALFLFLALSPIPLEAQEKRVLDHDVYGIWKTLGARAIAPNGQWGLYVLEGEEADPELVVRHLDQDREIRVERGTRPSFTRDSRFALFTIRPSREALDAARDRRPGGAGNNAQLAPRDSLGVLDLSSGEVLRIADVQSWSMPDEAAGWVAYHLHPLAEGASGDDVPAHGTLVLRDLVRGTEQRIPHATAFQWATSGGLLLVADSSGTEGSEVRILGITPGAPTTEEIMAGSGRLRGLHLKEDGSQALFLHQPPALSGEACWTLNHWNGGSGPARTVVDGTTTGMPAGWCVREFSQPSISRDGTRLYFGTAPDPTPREALSALEARVDVEIWHWEDPELMSVQNVRLNQERRRTFLATIPVGGTRMVQLADADLPQVQIPSHPGASAALGRDTRVYGIESSWESPNFADVYLVDLTTGVRTRFLERTQSQPSFSPEGRWITWYEPQLKHWFARASAGGEVRNLSASLPHAIWNEQNDSPSPPNSYGSAGWMENDQAILLNDRFDIWAVDPAGASPPRSVTAQAGRRDGVRYRILRLGRAGEAFGPRETVMLSAFNPRNKQAGFASVTLNGSSAPAMLLMEDRAFSNPVKASDADRILFTQETFVEFGDLWTADLRFRGRKRVSDANPQQADYRWGTADLVEWLSADGIPLQGVLMKPEDFDPSRKYPMVVYFYERWSDDLHAHYAMVPHRSRIAFPMYTSDDYLVFIPDIVYREGYPGESALNAVNPGIFKLIEAGFVDRDRVALQGHSWGGYQIAFMVTRSERLYRAAAAGAPVANMTSAYGALRRETGLVRQFQYERTQSRLGGTLWEMPLRYLENSPLFWVDKIETPLLIMHNDSDGHVPWEQGIELFTALRRLSKPAWMINYRGEPHWPTTFPNRVDWNVRMKQFFDHYLKDAPAPAWMAEGIPAIRRGETLGYAPVNAGGAGSDR